VKVDGKLCYLWRAVDHEGEVLEAVVTAKRDKAAALTSQADHEEVRPTAEDRHRRLLRLSRDPRSRRPLNGSANRDPDLIRRCATTSIAGFTSVMQTINITLLLVPLNAALIPKRDQGTVGGRMVYLWRVVDAATSASSTRSAGLRFLSIPSGGGFKMNSPRLRRYERRRFRSKGEDTVLNEDRRRRFRRRSTSGRCSAAEDSRSPSASRPRCRGEISGSGWRAPGVRG
jgi:hypothetical protein